MISKHSIVILFALTFSVGSTSLAQDERARFDGIHQLFGRHPSLRANKQFNEWVLKNGGSQWHEERNPDTKQITVVIQPSKKESKSILAALTTLPSDEQLEDAEKLNAIAVVEVPKSFSKDQAIEKARGAFDVKEETITTVRPSARFEEGKAVFQWEVMQRVGKRTDSYWVPEKGDVRKKLIAKPEAANQTGGANAPAAALPDEMATNELHNLNAFAGDTNSAIGNASAVADKARRIFNYVRNNYLYDDGIFQIDCFTWGDVLVRDTNGKRGICDEWAVVEITMLRKAGIPARMKLLAWRDSDGTDVAHACVEYKDGPVWNHMDALWNAFNQPSVYRSSGGASNVTVMDADYPLDSRSDANAWTCPDLRNDNKLNPYDDFVISPSYPGNQRPGYSN